MKSSISEKQMILQMNFFMNKKDAFINKIMRTKLFPQRKTTNTGQGLFQTFVGCDYRTKSLATNVLIFEKKNH